MSSPILFITMLATMLSSSTEYTKKYQYLTVCFYNANSDDYDSCDETIMLNTKFIFNHNNTKNIKYITPDTTTSLYLTHVKYIASHTNNKNEDVDLFEYNDNNGDEIIVIQSNNWVRILYENQFFINFN